MTNTEQPRHQTSHTQQGVRHTLQIEVPAEIMQQQVDRVTRAFRNQARLPGFRKGKAPLGMVRQQYGEEIRQRVLDHTIPEHLAQELEERGLEPLESPELEQVEFPPGGALSFTVQFDTAPEIKLQQTEFRVRRRQPEVTDELLQEALDELRDRGARLVPVEQGQAASEGVYARCQISLFPKDGKGKKLAEESRFVHVGSERAIPGLNVQLEGVVAGDEREFITELADGYPNAILAGKEVLCRVRVEELKQRQLPELDDEFARDVGFTDLEALREQVMQDLQRRLQHEADRDVESQLLRQLREANPVQVPSSLIERRLEQMVRRFANDLAGQGIDPRQTVDWAAFRTEQRPVAEHALAEEMLLDQLATEEQIEVDDDAVVAEIRQQLEAREGGKSRPVGPLVQQMRKDGSFEGLRLSLRRRLALERLRQRATIDDDGGDRQASAAQPGD